MLINQTPAYQSPRLENAPDKRRSSDPGPDLLTSAGVCAQIQYFQLTCYIYTSAKDVSIYTTASAPSLSLQRGWQGDAHAKWHRLAV